MMSVKKYFVFILMTSVTNSNITTTDASLVESKSSLLNTQQLLQALVNNVEYLQAIVITDHDGNIVSKAEIPALNGKTDDIETCLISFAMQQASKLDFGECNSLVAYYANCILIHLSSSSSSNSSSNASLNKNSDDIMLDVNENMDVDVDREAIIMTFVCLKFINMSLMFDMQPQLIRMLNTIEEIIEPIKSGHQFISVDVDEDVNINL